MPRIFEHWLAPRREDLDIFGHVNNVAYVAWMQAAAMAHSTVQGWSAERYLSLGCGWVVRTHKIEYLRPAQLEDEVVVRTWVANFRRASSERRYHLFRVKDQKLLAQASTDWVFVEFATLIPRRIPVELATAFEMVENDPPLDLPILKGDHAADGDKTPDLP